MNDTKVAAAAAGGLAEMPFVVAGMPPRALPAGTGSGYRFAGPATIPAPRPQQRDSSPAAKLINNQNAPRTERGAGRYLAGLFTEIRPLVYQNKHIRYQTKDYELFWTTQNAHHICAGFRQDLLHDVHHLDISQLLEHYVGVRALGGDRHVFLCWSGQRQCVYEVYAYLLTGSRNRPGRCIVITAYRSNKTQYITFVTNQLRA